MAGFCQELAENDNIQKNLVYQFDDDEIVSRTAVNTMDDKQQTMEVMQRHQF